MPDVLCKWCGIRVVRCIFLEFTGFTSRLLAMGADSANFMLFAGAVGELSEIWLIRSNFLEFSFDGQKSESSELDVDEF